jgi:hypothetical protein
MIQSVNPVIYQYRVHVCELMLSQYFVLVTLLWCHIQYCIWMSDLLYILIIYYDMIWYIYIYNCNWVDIQWQQYSTHLHTNSTQVDTRWQQYSTHLHANSTQVDTRWQQYSTHLHTNNTQNTENGTYITITKLNIHNNKKLTKCTFEALSARGA